MRVGTCLILLVFLAYKSSESLLQPTVRLFIYHLTCHDVQEHSSTNNHTFNTAPFSLMTWRYGSWRFLGKAMQTSANEKDGTCEHNSEEVKQRAATNLLWYRILLNAPGIVLSFGWGQLSDRASVGRKPPMLLPCWGAIAACFLFSLAGYFQEPPHMITTGHVLLLIFLGAAVYGFLGKSTVFTMACNSYVSDVSLRKERTIYLGRLLGMNFFGLFLGSLLVGITAMFSGLSVALLIVVISNSVIVAVIIFALPESRPLTDEEEREEEQKSKPGEKQEFCKPPAISYTEEKSNEIEKEEAVVSLCGRLKWIQCREKDRSLLLFLLVSTFLNQLCKAGEQDVLLLFLKEEGQSWSDHMYGYYLAVYYGCMGLNLVVTLPLLERFFHFRDTSLVIIGLAMKTVRLTMTTFLKNHVGAIFAAAVLGSLAGFISSSLRSFSSKLTSSADTGKTFALLSAMEALSNLLGPTLFVAMYTYLGGDLTFILDALLCLTLMIFFFKINILREDA